MDPIPGADYPETVKTLLQNVNVDILKEHLERFLNGDDRYNMNEIRKTHCLSPKGLAAIRRVLYTEKEWRARIEHKKHIRRREWYLERKLAERESDL